MVAQLETFLRLPGGLVLWPECTCPSKINVEILTPKVMVLVGEAFGR